jgi:hypothetical protein
MAECTPTLAAQTSTNIAEVVGLLRPQLEQLQQRLDQFRQHPVTPAGFFDLENELQIVLRAAGQRLLEQAVSHLEPDTVDEARPRITFEGDSYRRRPKQPKTISSSFGPVEYSRFRYESCEAGQGSLFPLDLQLGLEAHWATPALAECVGRLAVDHEQRQVLAILARDHDVSWSVAVLRKVTAAVSAGLASFREPAQIKKARDLLKQAFRSKGRHRPVVAVGRDGIMVPMRRQGYKEASSATVSIYDRRGRRLGTLYLGYMPELGQQTMTSQLTSLIDKILAQWHASNGACPRLVYITDGGHHPREFFQRVLKRRADPWKPGSNLVWQWVLDYWHVCGYVNKLAVALFGEGAKAHQWFRRMRRWLRDRNRGITQVLRSASQHQGQRRLSKAREETFGDAYRFLRKHSRWMQYASYRRQGLPIGSGVTEAACKTVFTQRLKRSGMSWAKASGQVIVDLRVLHLSGIWREVHAQYLCARRIPTGASCTPLAGKRFKKAA